METCRRVLFRTPLYQVGAGTFVTNGLHKDKCKLKPWRRMGKGGLTSAYMQVSDQFLGPAVSFWRKPPVPIGYEAEWLDDMEKRKMSYVYPKWKLSRPACSSLLCPLTYPGSKKKMEYSKAFPVTSNLSQLICETSRLPHFLDNRPCITHQVDSWYSFLLEVESTPGPEP
jgi:hypothetical protein